MLGWSLLVNWSFFLITERKLVTSIVKIWINMVENQDKMLHSKYQTSESCCFKRFFKSVFYLSQYKRCGPLGIASFDTRSTIRTNVITNTASCLVTYIYAISFGTRRFVEHLCLSARGEEFNSVNCIHIWNMIHPGYGQFWPKGHGLNKLGRGPLYNVTHHTVNHWPMWFQSIF